MSYLLKLYISYNIGMNLYDNIKEIIYINLHDRPDRKQSITDLLTTHFPDKKITRFDAYRPHHVPSDVRFIKNKLRDADHALKMPGIVGCYCSHLCILKELHTRYKNKSDTHDLVYIVEDDTKFDENFINFIKKPIKIKDWNIILGVNPESNFVRHGLNERGGLLRHIFGTNIVIYNLKKIDELYKKIISLPVIYDYDLMMFHNIRRMFFFDTNLIQLDEDVKESDIR